MIIIAFGAN